MSLLLTLWRGHGWLAFLCLLAPFLAPLLVFPGNPFPSLIGLFVQAVLAWFCLGKIWLPYAMPVISLVAGVALARWHEPTMGLDKRWWQSLPLFLALAGWLGVGAVSAAAQYWRDSVKGRFALFLSALLLLAGAAGIGYWCGEGRFVLVTLLVCFSAFIAHEVDASLHREWLGLLWVGLLVFSFAVFPAAGQWQLLRGYGAALMAVTLTWLAIGQREENSPLWQGAGVVSAFAFFRFFAETYPLRTPRADLYTHYTFVGFLLGAIVPTLLAWWEEQAQRFSRSLLTGFWAAVIPVALGGVWGVKTVAGYLGGAIAAGLLRSLGSSPTLYAGFATALPLTALVEPFSDLPRRTRLWVLVGMMVLLVLSILADRIVQRFSAPAGEQDL